MQPLKRSRKNGGTEVTKQDSMFIFKHRVLVFFREYKNEEPMK